jgi:hypothetical protein
VAALSLKEALFYPGAITRPDRDCSNPWIKSQTSCR